LLHHPQEQAQGRALKFGITLQEVAQPLRHRQYALPHRQPWQDVISEMRRPPPWDWCAGVTRSELADHPPREHGDRDDRQQANETRAQHGAAVRRSLGSGRFRAHDVGRRRGIRGGHP